MCWVARESKSRKLSAAPPHFVTAHLLLVEMGAMSIEGRIIVFAVIGILLMSTAFLGRKKKDVTGHQPPLAISICGIFFVFTVVFFRLVLWLKETRMLL